MAGKSSVTMTTETSQEVLSTLSAFSAQSYSSTEALVTALLQLISEQLGMRTSFLTEITTANNQNHILSSHNLEGGCDLQAGVDLPLNETFCSIITNAEPPRPLIIRDIKYDAVFGTHPAAAASPHIGCFVGVPIMLRDGRLFGTLCAIDPAPQTITTLQTDLLIVLARFVATQLDYEQDRTKLEQLVQERDELYQTAQETLREREALVAIASHELKNPLAALLGQAQLLQRHLANGKAPTERDQGRLDIIVRQAQRIASMLGELLDISQLDAGQMSIVRAPVDLSSIVQHVVDEMYALYSAHSVEVIKSSEPVIVNGDTVRLEQVVRNLFGNAIKYTPQGGHITLSVSASGSHAVLTIKDTGAGIASDALAKLFRRFYRAELPQGMDVAGFGIGLYVVKEIVTGHSGEIYVNSTPGEGSVFTVKLPLLVVGP